MTTPEANWIKMSERQLPDGKPAFVYYKEGQIHFIKNPSGQYSCTHWMPAELPPPPKVETQRERDERAWSEWFDTSHGSLVSSLDTWHAALAQERAFFRAELAKLSRLSLDCTLGKCAAEAYDRMVERCKEEGS